MCIFEPMSEARRGEAERASQEEKGERADLQLNVFFDLDLPFVSGVSPYPCMETGGGDLFQRWVNSGPLPLPGDLLMFPVLEDIFMLNFSVSRCTSTLAISV